MPVDYWLVGVRCIASSLSPSGVREHGGERVREVRTRGVLVDHDVSEHDLATRFVAEEIGKTDHREAEICTQGGKPRPGTSRGRLPGTSLQLAATAADPALSSTHAWDAGGLKGTSATVPVGTPASFSAVTYAARWSAGVVRHPVPAVEDKIVAAIGDGAQPLGAAGAASPDAIVAIHADVGRQVPTTLFGKRLQRGDQVGGVRVAGDRDREVGLGIPVLARREPVLPAMSKQSYMTARSSLRSATRGVSGASGAVVAATLGAGIAA